jgi:hypothetical protein
LVSAPPLPSVLDKFLSLAHYIFANQYAFITFFLFSACSNLVVFVFKLVYLIFSSPQEVGILFYCFSGSGRTTFAMCLFSLIVENLFPAHVAPLDEPMLVRNGSRMTLHVKKEHACMIRCSFY